MVKRMLFLLLAIPASYFDSASANDVVLACSNQYLSDGSRNVFILDSKQKSVVVLELYPEEEWVLVASGITYTMENKNPEVVRFDIADSQPESGDSTYPCQL